MPKNEKREYRTMPVMAVRRDAEGAENSFIVRGYASTFNEPYELFEDWDGNMMYEQVETGAFDGADMSDVIMQYDHEGMVYARTKNQSLKLWIDEHGLGVEADLGLTTESRKLYEAIQTGLVDQMSFCFVIDDEDFDKGTRTWTIRKIGKVYDVSAVSIPANPGTEISANRKKRMDGVIQEERAERLAKIRKQERIKIMRVKCKIAMARGKE